MDLWRRAIQAYVSKPHFEKGLVTAVCFCLNVPSQLIQADFRV